MSLWDTTLIQIGEWCIMEVDTARTCFHIVEVATASKQIYEVGIFGGSCVNGLAFLYDQLYKYLMTSFSPFC